MHQRAAEGRQYTDNCFYFELSDLKSIVRTMKEAQIILKLIPDLTLAVLTLL